MATNFYGGRTPMTMSASGISGQRIEDPRQKSMAVARGFFNGVPQQKRSFSALNYAPINDKSYSAIYGNSSNPYIRNNLTTPSNRQPGFGIANQGLMSSNRQPGISNANNTTGTGGTNTPPNFKNNLLNYILSPKGKGMAQGLLEASGYSETPIGFGQALAMGMKRGNEAQAQADATTLAKQKQAMDNLLIQSQIYKNYQPSGNPKDQYRPITKEERLAYGIPEDIPVRYNITQDKPEIMTTGSGTKVEVDVRNEAERKSDESFFKGRGENFDKYVTTTENNALAADIDNQSLNRFEQLASMVETGNLANFQKELLNWANSLGLDLSGVNLEKLGGLDALNSVAGRFVMQQVAKTKGAVSDREMAYFMKISSNISNSPLGNQLIINMARQMNDRAIAENDLLTTFLDEQYVEDPTQTAYALQLKWKKIQRDFREKNQLFTGDIAEEIEQFHKDNDIKYDDSTKKIEDTLSKYPKAKYIGVMEDGTLGFEMEIDGELQYLYI